MQNSILRFYFVLSLSLYIPAAIAEDISIPEKNHRQGMSYEEYANFREKMRLRMEKNHAENPEHSPASANRKPEPEGKQVRESTYGQGYHARQLTEDRPESGAEKRPDRPHIERFNRGDMMRR
jgi:hypothetical protein